MGNAMAAGLGLAAATAITLIVATTGTGSDNLSKNTFVEN